MKLSEFKDRLVSTGDLNFLLPGGIPVPTHFHITEAGLVTKNFIDCGGTVRTDKTISFQIWTAEDYDHRLHPDKLLAIISTYEKTFGKEDLEIEVEYQTDTIGKFGLDFEDGDFILTSRHTDCLAKETCGTSPVELETAAVTNGTSCCSPGSGCC